MISFSSWNLTNETLEFTDITGSVIANRGFLQKDIALGGLAYLQQITDRFDNTHQHFEPGVWANVPATSNPKRNSDGSAHGIHSARHVRSICRARAWTAVTPQIATSSITPFKNGSPDDGKTNLVPFPEETLATPSTSRTPLNQVATLTQAQLTDPNLFLTQAIAGQNIVSTTVLIISSDTSAPGSVPNAGGGTDDIAFLTGVGAPPTGGPNANAIPVTAIFWIEKVRDEHGKEFDQIQYSQRVILNFNGLSWPHVSVATLR